MATKAFSHLRVSSKGQIEGDGLPRQRDAIKSYSRRHKIEIVAEFRDEGISGTKDAFDRDGLTDLFVAIKSNGVKTVLIERSDRLARDLMVSEIILSEFRKLDVKVIAVDCGIDLTAADEDPTRKLIRQILGAIAEWDKSLIVQKLRAARVRIRKTEGRCEGRKQYGETEQEEGVIATINQLRNEGKTIKAISEILNERGVPPRKPSRAGRIARWHPTMVQRILAR